MANITKANSSARPLLLCGLWRSEFLIVEVNLQDSGVRQNVRLPRNTNSQELRLLQRKSRRTRQQAISCRGQTSKVLSDGCFLE